MPDPDPHRVVLEEHHSLTCQPKYMESMEPESSLDGIPPQPFPFLQLPSEIRDRIYNFSVGYQHIRIHYMVTTYHLETSQWAPKGRPRHFILPDINGPSNSVPNFFSDDSDSDNDNELQVSQLYRTCRQIYLESIPLYYALNAFSFTQDWMGHPWISSLQPWQKPLLTHLAFSMLPNYYPDPTGWCDEESLNKYFTGLKRLHVRQAELPHSRRLNVVAMEVLRRELLDFWTRRGVEIRVLDRDGGRARGVIEM